MKKMRFQRRDFIPSEEFHRNLYDIKTYTRSRGRQQRRGITGCDPVLLNFSVPSFMCLIYREMTFRFFDYRNFKLTFKYSK
jgi:hypothetical protein